MSIEERYLVPEPLTDFGYRKTYVCKVCNNLQPMRGICVLCWRNDTIVSLTKIEDKVTVDAPDSKEEPLRK
jgi:hypothetical protein